MDVDVHSARYYADYGGVLTETDVRFAVLWVRFDQPLFVKVGENDTHPVMDTEQGDLVGLARLKCGTVNFESRLDREGGKLVGLGSASLPVRKLVPVSHFDDRVSAGMHLRTPGHTDHNVMGWMLVLDWRDAAGSETVIAPALLSRCELFLETGGRGTRVLSNRMGEAVTAVMPVPEGVGDGAGCVESTVYDLTHMDPFYDDESCAAEDGTDVLGTSFLQVQEMSRMIPGLALILEPVLNTAMKPIINTVASTTGQDIMETLGDYLDRKLHIEVPGDLAAMLASTITANVTNMATDAVVYTTANKLVDSVTKELGAYLERSVSEALRPRLHTSLFDILSKSIPDKLDRAVPDMVSRATLLSLTHTLTRSVTHAVVPTLTEALTHTSHQDVFCHYCYYKHQYCNYCHYSAQSQYYNSYYSAYYSDYYSNFYATYYGSAVEAVDKVQHPESHGKESAVPEGIKAGEYPQHPWLEKS